MPRRLRHIELLCCCVHFFSFFFFLLFVGCFVVIGAVESQHQISQNAERMRRLPVAIKPTSRLVSPPSECRALNMCAREQHGPSQISETAWCVCRTTLATHSIMQRITWLPHGKHFSHLIDSGRSGGGGGSRTISRAHCTPPMAIGHSAACDVSTIIVVYYDEIKIILHPNLIQFVKQVIRMPKEPIHSIFRSHSPLKSHTKQRQQQ